MKFFLIALAFCVQPLFAQQGIKGKVEWITGNQMPGPGKKMSQPQPVVREIYIYEPTTPNQVSAGEGQFYTTIHTRLVKIVKSKKDGRYCAKLPPGEYSLFIKESQGFFGNTIDNNGRIQCVTVKDGAYTTYNISVNYQAVY